ncbi:MAG: SNF2-related protein [bacterium]|nr:SNF2-related protein [bacterium]
MYVFQQKAVLSLIKMLRKFDGAILADAVGLGKTWSALAVMKFFQLQGREVVLICPKKLQYNWNRYKKHQESRFEKDQFDYFIRFHTDMQLERMEKYTDRADKLFTDDKPKLIVIDESHNLRNDRSRRYEFLVDEILKRNEDIKVLMLSATPINNSLNDIRNQFKLMVKGNVGGFNESLGIKNIDYTFRTAQKAFSDWREGPNPRIGDFIKKLPANFFTLTDSLTVARTRAMIEGQQTGLDFPVREKPDNIFVTPHQMGNFESFEELFEHFPPMLSGYQPAFYVKVDDSEDKNILHDERQRDRFLVKMMYILMVKRLESSWVSFYSTVKKILGHHQNALEKIKAYQKAKKDSTVEDNSEISLFEGDDFEEDELEDKVTEFTLGKKRKINLSDIDAAGNLEQYKKDLKKDIDALDNLFYGVDIQPIATQISKLRFFISLIVDQKVDAGKDNFGVRPLPNLETKFVAANTLIGIDKPKEGDFIGSLFDDKEVSALEGKLKDVRHRLFSAKKPSTKRKLREEDQYLREKIAERLIENGWGNESAKQLASWDPYDQNASSPFFDPEWMFDISDGFDVVIANPPYVRAEEYIQERQAILASNAYETLYEKWDLYVPFIERGYNLLSHKGVLQFITSDAYCHAKYARKSQEWFLKNARIVRLDFVSDIEVFEAGVHNILFAYQRIKSPDNKPLRIRHYNNFGNVVVLPTLPQKQADYRIFRPDGLKKGPTTKVKTVPLGQICYVSYGLRANSDDQKYPGEFVTVDLLQDYPDAIHRPFVQGKDLAKWMPLRWRFLEYGTERAPGRFSRATFPELHDVQEKLITMRSPGRNPKTIFDNKQTLFDASSVGFVPWHALKEVYNRSIAKSARYRSKKGSNPPCREELEVLSQQFQVKYLLSVMNSSWARVYLLANRRSNIHLYPDDWKSLPIPVATPEQQQIIVAQVNTLLADIEQGNEPEVKRLGKKIDRLVYELYGLTEDEISIVEESVSR